MHGTSPHRRRLFFVIKLLISSFLIYLVYRNTPVPEMMDVFRNIDIHYLYWIVPLIALNAVMCTEKWRILLMADGVVVPFHKLIRIYMIGNFFNLFLPTNIGGDSYRIYLLSKISNQTVRSTASVFADRISGFLALVILSILSSFAVVTLTGNFILFVIPAAVFLLLLSLFAVLVRPTWVMRFLKLVRFHQNDFVVGIVEKFLCSVKAYSDKKAMLVRVLLLSFAFQFLVITCVYLFALSLHVSISFLYFSSFVPLITLLEALPISINGIGIRDFGYVYFFSMAGMNDYHTRALALMFLALAILYSLLGGLVYLCSGSLTDQGSEKKKNPGVRA